MSPLRLSICTLPNERMDISTPPLSSCRRTSPDTFSRRTSFARVVRRRGPVISEAFKSPESRSSWPSRRANSMSVREDLKLTALVMRASLTLSMNSPSSWTEPLTSEMETSVSRPSTCTSPLTCSTLAELFSRVSLTLPVISSTEVSPR